MAQRRPKPTDKPADTAAKPSSGDLVAESRKSEVWQGVTYQRTHKRLADGSRSKNAYWRAYWWDAEEGRTRSKYIGKEWRELKEEEF